MSRRILRVSPASALAAAAVLASWFAPVVSAPAHALPAGWFHIRGTVKDSKVPFALRSMDTQWAPDGRITGFIRMNASGSPKDSQLWKAVFPARGSIGQIKLRNKLTGKCISSRIARTSDGTYAPVLSSCDGSQVIWVTLPQGSADRVVFQEAFHSPGLPKRCLTKGSLGDLEYLRTEACEEKIHRRMVWEAYQGG
ncbi:hypothetical protein ABGB12_15020 [Actinocorallia sp. B10E7]|uniref:RICIN domain-containing protein n=1 Tax=Actinocorallia sp. B10E7 TaxID=3153558 RepID=UPI00325CA9C7